ncbi:MAG: hypothetical protein RL208_753 [Pseudomonadota bacterium]|jgi:hypothetical protein
MVIINSRYKVYFLLYMKMKKILFIIIFTLLTLSLLLHFTNLEAGDIWSDMSKSYDDLVRKKIIPAIRNLFK